MEERLSECFLVVCREDRKENGEKGAYTLATRTVFVTQGAAEEYLDGISTSRDPFVVSGDFDGLRFPEDQLRKVVNES